MKFRFIKKYFFTLSTLLCMELVSAGPLEDGLAAQNRGDVATAFTIFRNLSTQGDANAQFRLSLMYASGRGVPQNYIEQVRLLRLAAKQGNSQAQANLGVAYSKARGVLQDNVRAHAWFSLSAMAGNMDAVSNRDVMEKRMTPQQIAQARRMADDCRQHNFNGCD
jgi:TPR repeat protein